MNYFVVFIYLGFPLVSRVGDLGEVGLENFGESEGGVI